MRFTGEDLMNLLWQLYLDCKCDEKAIYSITREQLNSLDERARWRFQNGISILIRDGFLNRVEPGTVAIPFTFSFSARGIETINRMAISRNSHNNNIPGIPRI